MEGLGCKWKGEERGGGVLGALGRLRGRILKYREDKGCI